MECGGKAPFDGRKAKKKQVKDELDRMKQAEKKKRRLEKALATSAAIRLELEKKKQKKKEEQERLDEEEGAAIAEAVALHVLEDSNEVIMPKGVGNFSIVGSRSGFPLEHHHSRYSSFDEGTNWISSSDQYYGSAWNNYACPEFTDYGNWNMTEFSSLQIADDAQAGTYMFNRML
ncbi:unnamed protein product [Cuscuta epithymum]|uniref:Uncharacterized protein n=1 Tax=Cuscuta epithymum TaxID=186058 RepID=A0AAV0E4Z7_9ASTE|nr:unnamed protein product [Cuscuta epithymum]CAH9148196.1 unnamed protein product [Cuscuta epithymum]